MNSREIVGRIYNIQRYSVDDGPGIRTTVFFKGCPLRCQWCSNPESQRNEKEFMHRDSFCEKCGTCEKVCPTGAIRITDEGEYKVNRDRCTGCGKCEEVCLYKAISIMGQDKTVAEVMEVVLRDKIFYETSGGGMTISGGEVLFQPEFALGLLQSAKSEGIHTCIETTGFANEIIARKIFEKSDLIYYDIKSGNEETHEKYTGVGLETIKKNLKNALEITENVVVRVPFIPGINTKEEEINEIIGLLKESGKVKKLHLLPYHNYGAAKYKNLGRNYLMDNVKRPEKEILENAKRQFEMADIDCKIVV